LDFDSPPAAGDVGRAPPPVLAGAAADVAGRDVVPLFAVAVDDALLGAVLAGDVDVAGRFAGELLELDVVAGRFVAELLEAELLELDVERAGVVAAASANSLAKSEKPMADFPGGDYR